MTLSYRYWRRQRLLASPDFWWVCLSRWADRNGIYPEAWAYLVWIGLGVGFVFGMLELLVGWGLS